MSLLRGIHSSREHALMPSVDDMRELRESIDKIAGNDHIAHRLMMRVVVAAVHGDPTVMTYLECMHAEYKEKLGEALAHNYLGIWDQTSGRMVDLRAAQSLVRRSPAEINEAFERLCSCVRSNA